MTSERLPLVRFGRRTIPPPAHGFRLPAEWEPHRATWIVWPHNRADWDVKTSAVHWCFAEIVRQLVDGERIRILIQDDQVHRRACRVLQRTGIDLNQIDTYRIPTNRSWIRDSGPIFLVSKNKQARHSVAVTDWRFNGWARYRACDQDNAVAARLASKFKMPRFEVNVKTLNGSQPVVLEGGSIDGNGGGLLLTTEECLLGSVQARNPGLTRNAIEHVLKQTFGIHRVLWLVGGLAGDDTHGHVDNVARFVSPDTVVVAIEDNRTDPNYEPLRLNMDRLMRMRDLRGQRLRVVPIPMPSPVCFDGQRLPASYLNFYIGNRRLLVPTFNDPNDRLALNQLAKMFPTREVVGIHAVDLVLGLGGIHCVTQQEPC